MQPPATTLAAGLERRAAAWRFYSIQWAIVALQPAHRAGRSIGARAGYAVQPVCGARRGVSERRHGAGRPAHTHTRQQVGAIEWPVTPGAALNAALCRQDRSV